MKFCITSPFAALRRASAVFLLITAFISCRTQAPQGVENLGIFGESRMESVLGQDGCTPVPLDGALMWTFGDTILGTWKNGLSVNSTFEDSAVMKGMLSNSLAFSGIPDDQSVASLDFHFFKEDKRVSQFIRHLPGEDPQEWRYWALDGIQLGPTVFVYYIIVRIDKKAAAEGAGLSALQIKGGGLAEWRKPASWKVGGPVRFTRTVRLFKEGEPVMGDSIIKKGAFLYLTGRGPAEGGRVPAYIARVPASSIRNRASYEFFDADGGWSAVPAPVMSDVSGEFSLSYSGRLESYLIIYCGLDGNIRAMTFRDFDSLKDRKPAVIYTPPPLPRLESRPFMFYYSGKEIFQTENAVYAVYMNPAVYQPVLLKIPYSALHRSPD